MSEQWNWKYQTVTLANGADVPLGAAAHWYGVLEGLMHLDRELTSDWENVYHLRELCLGRPLDPEIVRSLAGEGLELVSRDGNVDPVLRDVVLASVRGQERAIYLDDPFTDSADRAMAEYINAREKVRLRLDDDLARRFLSSDPVEDAVERYVNEQTSDEASRDEGLPESLADPNFAQRIVDEAMRKKRTPRPPAPPADGDSSPPPDTPDGPSR